MILICCITWLLIGGISFIVSIGTVANYDEDFWRKFDTKNIKWILLFLVSGIYSFVILFITIIEDWPIRIKFPPIFPKSKGELFLEKLES